MANTYFLDANIFLEVGVPPEDYHDECEKFFESEHVKKTSERVVDEVQYIMSRRTKIIPHLARHYHDKGSKKFEPPYEINTNTFDFIDELLFTIGTGNRYHISRRIRALFSMIEACIERRFGMISGPLITSSNNDILHNLLIPITTDADDAWHIVDATEWAKNNSSIIFCSFDRIHIINPSREILICVCDHYGWRDETCPLSICHLLSI